MGKIPVPTSEAIMESYNKIIRKDLNDLSYKDMSTHLKKHLNNFQIKQPELYKYVKKLSKDHIEILEGNMSIPQFLLYTLVLIDSLYVQDEINEIGKLFE